MIKILISILFICIIIQEIQIIHLRTSNRITKSVFLTNFAKLVACLYSDDPQGQVEKYFKIRFEEEKTDLDE